MANKESVSKLDASIAKAYSELAKTFGTASSSKYGALDFFEEKGLNEAYQKEEIFTNIANQLSSFGKEVRRMRSSYLPIEIYKDYNNAVDSGSLTSELSDGLASLESYENTFMRMLGMPQSDELGFASGGAIDNYSAQVGSINYITKDGKLTVGASFYDIENDILLQRSKLKSDRKVIVNNYIYDLDKKGTELEETESDTEYPKLIDFEKNPYSFCYLLFPPIQDSRFSRCINEPSKITAPLFSNPKARQINSVKIKPTLLESIIRIRIDKLSGQSYQSSLKESSDTLIQDDSFGSVDISVTTGKAKGEDIVEPFAENYGILESLFIVRLRSSISGLAKKFGKDRDEIIASMEKIRLKISEGDSDENADGTGSISNEVASVPSENETAETNPEEEKLKNQLLIEDSMMSLLGNNSGAIDLQKNTQRNSSVYDAHLMSGLIGIIDVPRGRLKERLYNMKKKEDNHFRSITEPIRADINSVLGTDIGIGNLDMIIFCLALFTISEKHLLNLLSDSDYEKLKNITFGNSLDSIAQRSLDSRIAAVNEVTNFAYDGYKIFAKDMSS